jgi:hypothetical protein
MSPDQFSSVFSKEKSSIDIVDMRHDSTSDKKTMLICPKYGAASPTGMVKAE